MINYDDYLDDDLYDDALNAPTAPATPPPAADEFDAEWDPQRGWRWQEGVTPQASPGPQYWSWVWRGYGPDNSRPRNSEYGWQNTYNGPTTPQSVPAPPPGVSLEEWRTRTSPQGYPSGTGGGTGGTGAVSGVPSYGQFLPYPEFQSAGPFQPRDDTFDFEPFSYEPFAPSSYADLEKQPGFVDDQNRLRKQIESSAAYRGMLRSGMTLGDLWTGLDTNKAQRFAEFDNRRFRDYQANRGNAFEAWAGNLGANQAKFRDEYGIDKDRYAFQAADVDRGNRYRFDVADASFKDQYNRWKAQVDSLTQIATAGAGG